MADVNSKTESEKVDGQVEDNTVETPANKSKVVFSPEQQAYFNSQDKLWKKKNDDLVKAHNAELESLNSQLEEAHKLILESKMVGLSDREKKLVAKLNYQDALDYLAEIQTDDENTSKKVTPKTPESKKVDISQPVIPLVKFKI